MRAPRVAVLHALARKAQREGRRARIGHPVADPILGVDLAVGDRVCFVSWEVVDANDLGTVWGSGVPGRLLIQWDRDQEVDEVSPRGAMLALRGCWVLRVGRGALISSYGQQNLNPMEGQK